MAVPWNPLLLVRAVRLKLRLLTAYDTFWPAVGRGVRLLLTGRWRAFIRKLFNELPEARGAVAVGRRRDGPILFLAGHVLGHGGYDQVVLNVLKGLTAAGVHVCRDARACLRKELVPVEWRPTELRRRGHPRLVVCPPHLLRRYRPDARTAVLTMWETDTLPPGSVEWLNRCGLVLVPSRWGADCFRANGVRVPIAVVPLGYDPEVFSPIPGTPRPGPPVTTFGTAGALDEGGLRKNVQRVIDLFRRAFPRQMDVRLRVKITPASPPVRTDGDPRVEVIATYLTPKELAEWYRSLSAYVNASAGEGFGLHLLEAMACGVPLISTTFGGVGAYFDGRVGYEIGYRPTAAWNAIYRGTWSQPDEQELIDRMWRVYRDGEEARRLGRAAAIRAMRFRWDDTIRRLVLALIRHGFIGTGPGGRLRN